MTAGSDLRPSHDWQKIVLFVLTCAGAAYAFGDKIFVAGRQTVTADRAERIEKGQGQMAVDIERAKLQAEMANASIQRVETKVDSMNEVLVKIRITGRR